MAVTLLLLRYQAKKAGGGKSRRRDSLRSAWLSSQKTFILVMVHNALRVPLPFLQSFMTNFLLVNVH
jgi:hypothetical protein